MRSLLAIVLAGCVVGLGASALAGPLAVSHAAPSSSPAGDPTASPRPSPPASPSQQSAQPTASPSVAPTFFDDFNGSKLNKANWESVGEWGCCGLSIESDLRAGGTVSVGDGIVRLGAERGATGSGRSWRSSVISTRGLFSQRYGVFQARMRWTKGNGLWPAFWLLEANAEGPRPEFDIVEDYPDTKNPAGVGEYIVVNHYRDSRGALRVDKLTVDAEVDLTADWHIYELDWRSSHLIIRLDGREVGRLTSPPPSTRMFLVLDMVVGSPLGHSEASTPSPAYLEVDWIRVSK